MKLRTPKILAISLLVTLATIPVSYAYNFNVEENNARFSEEYEPMYPMITATTKSTDEMYEILCRNAQGLINWTDSQHTTRRAVVQMYKDAGIDITWNYDGTDNLDMFEEVQMRMEDDKPTRWSKKTPKPLEGNYEQCFSIDACWNNKIPDYFPRVELTQDCFKLTGKLLIGTVRSTLQDGNGTGIPVIIGREGDKISTIVDKEGLSPIRKLFEFRTPDNAVDYINTNTDSDQHAIFIDDEQKIGIHTWHTRPAEAWYPYDFQKGAWPGYDIRVDCGSNIYQLDGIGYYGREGVYAVQVPALGFMVRRFEITDPDQMINHAIGGSLDPLFPGIVYPATRNDARMDVARMGNIGAVPQGGIVQLDPDFDLDAVYESGKLSLPAYKVLKAMQEYGLYNLDHGDNNGNSGLLLYSETSESDWSNSQDSRYNVPVMGGEQGLTNIQREIEKFLDNDSFFGLSERPKLFVTIPNVKYAELDINGDDVIDEKDEAIVAQNLDMEITDSNKLCDVDQDGEISGRDLQVYYNYFNDLPQHERTYYTISYKDLDKTQGNIVCSDDFVSWDQENGVRIKEGMTVSVGAAPNPGYEFVEWTHDFAGHTSPTVVIDMTKDYTIGAKFRKKTTTHDLVINIDGGGKVEVTTDGKNYFENEGAYCDNDLIGLRATPDEGMTFVGWEGDLDAIFNETVFVMEKDIEVTAKFEPIEYTIEYKDEDWDAVNAKFIQLSPENEYVFFDWNNFSASSAVVNNKVNLEDGYTYRVRVNNTTPLGDGNDAKIIFNYKDSKNYYYVRIGGKGGNVRLCKVFNGVESTLRTYVRDYITEDGVNFNLSLPIDIKITRTKDCKITVEGFRENSKLTYFEDVRDTSIKGGKVGVGSLAHGFLKMEKLSVNRIGE